MLSIAKCSRETFTRNSALSIPNKTGILELSGNREAMLVKNPPVPQAGSITDSLGEGSRICAIVGFSQ